MASPESTPLQSERAAREPVPPLDGILLLDKPVGVSSFQALYPVKRAFGGGKRGNKIGHAGTLDPAASGLLLLGIGSGTRLLEFLEGLPKSYRFTLHLGITTDSYDLEGHVLERRDASAITRAQIEALLPRFRGPISQFPPVYSAIKIDGKRACDRVRAGEEVTMVARPVRIDRLEIISFDPDQATAVMELDCSKGTYVRTLAHDLGQLLGCGAVAAGIRRTAIGPFRVEDAVSSETLRREDIRPPESAVTCLPGIEVKSAWINALLNGNAVPPAGYAPLPVTAVDPHEVDYSTCAIFSSAKKLLAIGELNTVGQLNPRKVFPTAA